MAITEYTTTRVGANTWRARASSDVTGASFYWYRNGRLVARGVLPFFDFEVSPGESVRVDVYDSAEDVPPVSYPGRALLEWENRGGRYRVDEWLDDAWVSRGVVGPSARGSLQWPSGVLADGALHQFRVVALGADGNAGEGRVFGVMMVRLPDPPGGSVSYDAVEEALTWSGV